MTDLDALRAAVLADRDDDTARLVFADAVEERGNAAWAGLIRGQVADRTAWPASVVPEAGAALREPCWAELPASQIMIARGFACGVACSAAYWLWWGDTILAAHPIERVSLTTRLEVDVMDVHSGYVMADPGPYQFRILFHTQGYGKPGEPYPDECKFASRSADEFLSRLLVNCPHPSRFPPDAVTRVLLDVRWPGVEFEHPRPASLLFR